jgi:uncharacterized protein YegL
MPIGYDRTTFDPTNPSPRVPCILLLDTSASMRGGPIADLNDALRKFDDDLKDDAQLQLSLELGIVTFGPVAEVSDFTPASGFIPPMLEANGPDTPMGAAILMAVDKLQARKAFYRSQHVSYHQPWLVMITDGQPTDPQNIPAARSRVHDLEAQKKLVFIAAGIEGADMRVLSDLSVRPAVPARSSNLARLFEWLSASLSIKSASRPGDQAALPPLNMGTA